jgi:hypothetical protein
MTTTTKPLHTFHIPVMGLAYTIDSPIRGISSVMISIIDDDLIENEYFTAANFALPRNNSKKYDYRAERVTSYLVCKHCKEFENFKNELAESKLALENYIAMLPNKSEIKLGLQHLIDERVALKTTLKFFLKAI